MQITRIPVGDLYANCYIIETKEKNAVAVDPGSDFNKIKEFVNKNNLILKKILLTHGHFDHIGAVAQAVEKLDADVYIHEQDAIMLGDRILSLADALGGEFFPVEKYNIVKNGDIIKLDELEFEVIHTPGHTKGGVCYKCENSLFTGDTLFKMSMGRTDFPGGSLGEMYDSLRKISSMNGNFDIYPGHNETSTLDFERKNNVYLKGNPYEDFI